MKSVVRSSDDFADGGQVFIPGAFGQHIEMGNDGEAKFKFALSVGDGIAEVFGQPFIKPNRRVGNIVFQKLVEAFMKDEGAKADSALLERNHQFFFFFNVGPLPIGRAPN